MQAARKDIVGKWNEAKLIWCHLLDHNLHMATLDHLLLFSHCPSAPTERGGLRVAALTHHTHGCPVGAVRLCTRQVSRLVVSIGHRVTCIVPVFQGCHLPNATKSLDLKGIHLNTFLAEMLLGSGLLGQQDLDIMGNIRRHYCYVAPDFRQSGPGPRWNAGRSRSCPRSSRSLWARSCYSAQSCCSASQRSQGCYPWRFHHGQTVFSRCPPPRAPGAGDVAQNMLL